MATLTGTQIKNTYDSLLKIEDNDGISTVKKLVTDGLGNATPLSISSLEVASSVDLEATGFKTPAGTSNDYLMADGSTTGLITGNVQSDWNATTGDAFILNKPTIPYGNQIIDWTVNVPSTEIHSNNLPSSLVYGDWKIAKQNVLVGGVTSGVQVNFVKGANTIVKVVDDVSTNNRFDVQYSAENDDWDDAYTHSQSAHAPSNAEANVQSDWNATSGDSLILNKPTIPSGNEIIDWTVSQGAIDIHPDNYVSSAALSGGTDNYVPLWNGTDALESSVIYQDGTNIGIGTTNPDGLLHIDGISDTKSGIVLEASNNGDNRVIDFQNTAGGLRLGLEYDNSAISLDVVNRSRDKILSIKETGSVGVGTVNPSEILQITDGTSNTSLKINAFNNSSGTESSIKFASVASSSNYTKGEIAFSSDGGAGRGDIHFRINNVGDSSNVSSGNEIMTLVREGNVGIGTTSPTSKLQVNGLSSYSDNAAAISGGLTVGAFYHTSGTLKVVI